MADDPIATVSQPVVTPVKLETVTDKQTWALKIAGWVRTGVTVAVILLGMVGVQVTFKQVAPTPPDQGIQQLIDALGKLREQPAPVVNVQPVVPATPATEAPLTKLWLPDASGEPGKGSWVRGRVVEEKK